MAFAGQSPGVPGVHAAVQPLAARALEVRHRSGCEQEMQQTVRHNQARVLQAFQEFRVSDTDFAASTGYGLDDPGRDKLEGIWARVFEGEAALVRQQIVSGTHALALALRALLQPGQELVSATGTPYDTLHLVIGHRNFAAGSLAEAGVKYREVALGPDGSVDLQGLRAALGPNTGAVFVQRSRGYSSRPALGLADIRNILEVVRESPYSNVPVLVDNCYGEFVQSREPPALGTDLTAGSLIKNPGGGLAPTGGYLVGHAKWIERAAAFLNAPGLGLELGATLDTKRAFFQGLFWAPHVVGQALLGAVFAAELLQSAGFEVSPEPAEERNDIVQRISFPSREHVLAFCQGIQNASPVDSALELLPSPMPGYGDEIIMGCGTFIQGSSLELSADAPLREPYGAYLQGGLSAAHVEIAVARALDHLRRQGLWTAPGH